jgi:hypothetical protein
MISQEQIQKVLLFLRGKSIAHKHNPIHTHRGHFAPKTGVGSSEFSNQMASMATKAEGRAAGLKRGSEIINEHHNGDGTFHPKVHDKFKGEIAWAADNKSLVPKDAERNTGYVKGLTEAHSHLKTHENRMKK